MLKNRDKVTSTSESGRSQILPSSYFDRIASHSIVTLTHPQTSVGGEKYTNQLTRSKKGDAHPSAYMPTDGLGTTENTT